MSEYTIQKYRGRFAIVWRDDEKKRHRYQLEAQDRASAQSEARDFWESADTELWNVGRAVAKYLDRIEAEKKPSAQRRRDAWKAAAPFWEKVDPSLIDEKMAKAYSEARKASPATVRLELSVVGTAVRTAPKANVPDKPDRMWLPKTPDPIIRHLTVDEFHNFLECVVAPHARLYMQLGIFTLARPSALLELQWNQSDFRRNLIQLNPDGRVQNSKRRPTVRIGEILHSELRAAWEMRTSPYVIEYNGSNVASIKKAFRGASERSQIYATPYTLRHTGAVWAAEAGVSMAELAQMMGHDDDRTTQKHYARFTPDFLLKVSDAVEATYAKKVQSEPSALVIAE